MGNHETSGFERYYAVAKCVRERLMKNYERIRLTIYVAGKKPFPDEILFVAYWHTDDPKRALIDPFLYEHAARGDLECRLWFAKMSTFYTWDFVSRDEVGGKLRAFMLELSELRQSDFQRFFGVCMAAIAKRPKRAFQIAFR